MDPATLATQVITALAPVMPYLGSAGTAIAGKIGEDVYARGKKLYEALHVRFAKEPDDKASTALQAFVGDPDQSNTVEIKLQRLLQSDPAFAELLRQIMQAHTGPRMVIEASDQASVRKNAMKNTQKMGFQGIRASGDANVEENEMTILDE